MSQGLLYDVSPIKPIPKGIVQVAPKVFRNLDTGVTWSLRSHPWCCAAKAHRVGEPALLCRRRPGHSGRHRMADHSTGFWVHHRWNEAECQSLEGVTSSKKRRPIITDADDPRRRSLSEETKQRIRRKSLARRIRAKVPLFAEERIAEELFKQPEYFGRVSN